MVSHLEKLADRACLIASYAAAIALLLLVALTVVDVVGRYVFTMPLVGAVELVRISMAAIIFLSFPVMFFRNDHIVVDLIPFMKKRHVALVSTSVGLLMTAYIGVYLGNRVFGYAQRAVEDGDVTEYLSIPVYLIVGFIAFMIWAATLLALLRLVITLIKPAVGAQQEVSSRSDSGPEDQT